MKRLRSLLVSKFFLIPVVVLLLYALLGYVITPYAVRWYVPKYAQEQLHCRANLGKVFIDPFLMRIEVKEFNLAEPEGEMVAAFERLFLDFELSGLFRWAAKFREFSLEKPAIHIAIEPDGSLNLAKLAPKSAEEKPKEPDSKSFGLILESAAITDGEVTVTDKRQITPALLTFQDLDLELKAISTVRDKNGTYALAAKTRNGETIQWQGEIGLAPFRSSGKLACAGLLAETFWGFAKDSVKLDSPSGKLDLSTDYKLDANGAPVQLTLENIKMDLSALSLKLTGAEDPFFALNKFEIGPTRLDLAARTVQTSSILVDGGMLRLRIDEAGQSNLQQIVLKKQGRESKEAAQDAKNEAAQQPSQNGPPWTVDVQSIAIKDFAMDVVDLSRASPVTAGIAGISVDSKAKIKAGAKMEVTVTEIATELKDVHLGKKDAPRALFEVKRLALEEGEFDLSSQSFTASRLLLSDGHIDLTREKDGKTIIEQLIASRGAARDVLAPEAKPAEEQSSPWNFLLKLFELSNFRSALADYSALPEKPLYNVQGLNVRATNIDGKSPMGLDINFGLEQGGKVVIQGKADPSKQSVEANVKVAGLALSPLQPYLAPFITLTLQSAAVSTEGTFRYGVPGSGSKLGYDGSLNLDKLSLNEPGSKETYIGFGAMKIPQMKLALEPNRLQIGEIRLTKPLGELIISEDGTVNLSKILKEQPDQAKPDTPAKSRPKIPAKEPAKKATGHAKAPQSKTDDSFPFNIGKVRIEDGNLLFADFSLRPKFMTRIHSLKGAIGKLSSEKKTVTNIALDGRVDRYGTAKVSGSLDINDFKRTTDITIVMRNVEMANVTPYSGKFAGRKIKSGKLSMDLKYRIENTKLIGDNKIIVDNLVLGERVESPDAVNLPLDLAIALLSDSNGRIDIGLPVTGNLDDPKFSIGPLIWKAFVNIITKAVTAPFRALGSLFGDGAEKFDAVQFDAGSAELQPPEKEKLKKLAEALQKRPQLMLIVKGRYSPEADGLEFRQLSVNRAVRAASGTKSDQAEESDALDLSDSKTKDALEKMYDKKFGSKALDELDQAIKKGEIKPRTKEEPEAGKKAKKRGGFAGMMDKVKIYKVVPGMKSPEQSELMAAEIYARLVEAEQASEKDLQQLAGARAQAVAAELQNTLGVPADRVQTGDSEPQPEDAGLSAGLSLDALSAVQ
ncbi:MAG: DUF748 domain-containing protein [Syntrophobacteraceae bacterium]